MKYTLLENGLDFILSALGHLNGTPSKRDLKYAVLHLSSGIELILKERLQLEHWTLIFDKPEEAKLGKFKKGDFNSVNFKSCIKRLINICGIEISESEQRKLNSFRDKRNRLEHFGIIDTVEAIKANTVDALSFLIDFIKSELDEKSFQPEEVDMINNIRKKLSEFETFVEKRLKKIQKEIDKAETAIVTCPSCAQDTLVLEDGANCLFCGYRNTATEAAKDYVSDVLGECYYTTFKDGGTWPVYECPECGLNTLVDRGISGSQYHHDQFFCFSCGYAWKEGELDFCMNCGELYDPGDDGMSICNRCFNAVLDDD